MFRKKDYYIKKVLLGNLKQSIVVRGDNKTTRPVLLYLHGGPGMPEVSFAKHYCRYLEEKFIVIYWEQRGAGKSYYGKSTPNLTPEQLLLDAKELSEYLSKEFNQDKIYILGHSWGSMLGIMLAKEYPNLFYAYLSIGQVTKQYKSEELALNWLKLEANKYNKKALIKKVAKLKLPKQDANIKEWISYLNKQRVLVQKFGGSIHNKSVSAFALLKYFIFASEYSLKEKILYIKGTLFSLKKLWSYVIKYDVIENIDSIDIPIYFFQGKYDYITSTKLTNEFFNKINAPKKEFFLFEESGHNPHWEEVDKFNKIIDKYINL